MAEKQSADADTSRGYYPRAGEYDWEAGKKLLVQNKNRMMNFLNNSSSGFYVHRKSFLIWCNYP